MLIRNNQWVAKNRIYNNENTIEVKLGKTTDIRMAMLRTLTTDLLLHGKVETTETRAKEVKAIVDSIISLAIKEKDNFEMVEVKVVKEETTEKRQKDMPSRLNARRKMMTKINKVKDTDVIAKLFNEIAPKYEGRVGGYTRIIKAGPRKGDGAEVAILQLV